MDDQEIPEIIAPDKLEVKGPDNSSPPPSKPQPQKSETQKKRKSWLARLLRFFVLFGIACIVLLVAMVVALQYFSPYEKIRPQAEAKISELLGLPVSIGAVEFSPISGARVQDLVVGGEQPLLKIREAVLDYDLSELFQGKLVINQVLVDRPELTLISRDGVWNFQGILDRLQKKQAAPEPTAPTPPIAVAVDLKELLIKTFHVSK